MAEDHRGNIVGNPDTSHGGHRPTPRLRPEDKAMKAREESLGEDSEYETEAKYAADYQKSLEDPVDEETYKNHWGSIKEQMDDSYRRGYQAKPLGIL